MQRTSWKVFYGGLRGSAVGEVICGDVVVTETAGRQVVIKVGSLTVLIPASYCGCDFCP